MYFFEKQEGIDDKIYLKSKEDGSVTYGEYNDFCEKMGQHMKPRTLIFILCENAVGSVLGYMACLRKKVVPLLLDTKMDREMLKELICRYEPDYIYQREKDENKDLVFEGYGYHLYEFQKENETKLADELALLLTTSGSTGSPKLVRQSYENIQSNADSIAQYLQIKDTDRPITTLPMNYTYGLSIIHSHTLRKATILITDKTIFEQEFWDFFQEEKATSMAGVPFTYEMLKRIRFFNMRLPSLRVMTQAGGKLSRELQKEYGIYARKNGIKFVIMYGQTEATARMAYLPAECVEEKAGSIGIPIPGGKFTIVNGELVYEGKNVTLGYAKKKEDLQKGDDRRGILYTGDMARKDENGFYYIIGRKKRFLKLLGSRVNLDEVEQLLKDKFQGTCFACTGVDDRLDIFVEQKASVDEEEIAMYISKKTKMNMGVFCVKQIPKIPVNSSGKVQYKLLEEM